MNDETNTTDVCAKCHTSVQNDDWTWIDLFTESPEDSQTLYDQLTTNAEYLDPSEFPTSHDETVGYWQCWVCDDIVLGTAYRYTLQGVER